jgi:hypothetical protein
VLIGGADWTSQFRVNTNPWPGDRSSMGICGSSVSGFRF